MGHEAYVTVWDATTLQNLATLPDLHLRSVSNLVFSSSSALIATVGLDEDHTISIFDWKTGMLVTRMHGGSSHVLDIAFSDDDKNLVSCGIKEMRFWSDIMSRTPSYFKPTLGEIGQSQPYLTCRFFAGNPTVGTGDGNLYIFVDNALILAVKAHDGPVATMSVNIQGNLLVTGGKDGAVRIWNAHLECTKEIPVGTVFDSINPKVRSVAFSADGNNIIVGTRGAEILELAVRSGALVGKPLIHGHGCRDLWGLATHPTKDEFVTSGDDATIRVWDAKSYSIIKTIKVDTASRAIAYSPDGNCIAVGFGFGRRARGKGPSKEGAFVVFSAGDMKLVHEGKDSNEPIRVCRYSPDSSILAIGSEDANITIYNAKDFYTKRYVVSAHKAPVLYIDFTVDGNFICSVDSTRRMGFSDMTNGQVVPSPATLREAKWSTWSSPVGWPVQGLWMCQPEEVVPCALMRSWGGGLVAAGTTGGTVVVAHSPCPERPGFISARGHSGPISQVSWLAGDHSLITIGQKDHCILQWKCIFDTTRESGDEGGISCEDSEVERDAGHEFKESDIIRFTDNMGNIQQWSTAISPPSAPEPDSPEAPKLLPKIDFVHGSRLGDTRQTVHYNDNGHVVYIAVNFGIVFDRDNQLQHVYRGHCHGLLSLAVDNLGKIAATGELAASPELHLWDARTADFLAKFVGLHQCGITSLSFSSSGEYLVSLGQDCMHSIVVLRSPTARWFDGYVVSSTSVSPQKMLWSLYTDQRECPIVIGGAGLVYFFRQSGKSLERVRGVFGKRKKLQPVLCGIEGDVDESVSREKSLLTGTVTGHIYVWNQQRVISTVTAHDGPVYAITKLRQGFATAGKEGLVKLWSGKLQLVHTYNMRMFSPQPFGSACHSLKCNLLGTRIVVGMKTNEIYEISLPTHSNMLLVEGHCYSELHGVDCNPQDGDQYSTVGDDGILRVWSYRLRTCLRRVSIEAAGRALAYFPDGKRIIVGMGGDPTQATKDGAFVVVDSKTLEILFEDRKAKLYLTDIKFSPKGDIIAMTSADSKIYIHAIENFAHIRTISTPTKSCIVSRVDFSDDGATLRCCTDKDELYHLTMSTGDIITSPLAARDFKWASDTCIYTYSSQGLFGLFFLLEISPSSYLSFATFPQQDFGDQRQTASMFYQSLLMPRRTRLPYHTKTGRFAFTNSPAPATRTLFSKSFPALRRRPHVWPFPLTTDTLSFSTHFAAPFWCGILPLSSSVVS
jgi:microtubule-associated protein-like 6